MRSGSRSLCLGLAALLLFALSWSAGAHAQEKIKISFSNVSESFIFGAVAVKKGFLKEEGLDAELVRVSGNVAMTALATGEIDYTLLFGSVVRATLKGLPFRMLASFVDSPTGSIVAQPGIKSLKELKGKNVSISRIGGGAHVTAYLILERAGLNPKEVKFVGSGGGSARFAALQQKLVDAALLTPAHAAKAGRLGFNVLGNAYEYFTFPYAGLGVTTKKIEKDRDQVKRVLKALIRGSRYIRQDRDGTIDVIMGWAKTDKQGATDMYEGVKNISSMNGNLPEEGMRLVIDQVKKETKTNREVPVSEVADLSILKEAQKELNLK